MAASLGCPMLRPGKMVPCISFGSFPAPASRTVLRMPRLTSLWPAAASSAAFEGTPEQPAPEREYTPFPRLKEKNPYRLLGVAHDASFEEVQEARNYLFELYRWHEPSRESIELAFETVLAEQYKARQKHGFRPPRTGRRTDVVGEVGPRHSSLAKKINDLFDPTVTMNTLINEGVVYAAMGMWALFSSDQSFPLAGAFAYSVYKYQQRRMKANPEGPHFGGNPIVGAVLTTAVNIGIACGVMALVSAPVAALLDASMRQVGALLVICIAGALSVYVK